MQIKNKLKGLKIGDTRKFTICNPNWKHPIKAEGMVSIIQNNKFNGMVVFTNVKILDTMLIRAEQIL